MPISFADGTKTYKYDVKTTSQVMEELDTMTFTMNELQSNAKITIEDIDQLKESLDAVQKITDDHTTALQGMTTTIDEHEVNLQSIIKFLNTPFMRFLNYFGCWYYITKDTNTGKYHIQSDNRTDRKIRKSLQKNNSH